MEDDPIWGYGYDGAKLTIKECLEATVGFAVISFCFLLWVIFLAACALTVQKLALCLGATEDAAKEFALVVPLSFLLCPYPYIAVIKLVVLIVRKIMNVMPWRN